jgi:hypothetical protein
VTKLEVSLDKGCTEIDVNMAYFGRFVVRQHAQRNRTIVTLDDVEVAPQIGRNGPVFGFNTVAFSDERPV